MKSVLVVLASILLFAASDPAAAALVVGDRAPKFSARGAQGEAVVTVDLSAWLKTGPVVIFFFPSAFTDAPECREFADNINEISSAGISVVGISRDSIDTLVRFSADECSGKFPLVSANEALVNGFDVNDGAMFNTRTTYIVAPSGKVVLVHDGNDYRSHVKSVLAFVRGMPK